MVKELFLLTSLAFASSAQTPPAEPPTISLKSGIRFIGFVGVNGQIWLVLAENKPKGVNYILINPDGNEVLVVFEPYNKS